MLTPMDDERPDPERTGPRNPGSAPTSSAVPPLFPPARPKPDPEVIVTPPAASDAAMVAVAADITRTAHADPPVPPSVAPSSALRRPRPTGGSVPAASGDRQVCMQCGYELLRYSVDHPCPECGARASTGRLTAADREWLGRVNAGRYWLTAAPLIPVPIVLFALLQHAIRVATDPDWGPYDPNEQYLGTELMLAFGRTLLAATLLLLAWGLFRRRTITAVLLGVIGCGVLVPAAGVHFNSVMEDTEGFGVLLLVLGLVGLASIASGAIVFPFAQGLRALGTPLPGPADAGPGDRSAVRRTGQVLRASVLLWAIPVALISPVSTFLRLDYFRFEFADEWWASLVGGTLLILAVLIGPLVSLQCMIVHIEAIRRFCLAPRRSVAPSVVRVAAIVMMMIWAGLIVLIWTLPSMSSMWIQLTIVSAAALLLITFLVIAIGWFVLLAGHLRSVLVRVLSTAPLEAGGANPVDGCGAPGDENLRTN